MIFKSGVKLQSYDEVWLKMILLLFWPINFLKILNVVRMANWNIFTFSQFCFQFAMKIIFFCRDWCHLAVTKFMFFDKFYAAVFQTSSLAVLLDFVKIVKNLSKTGVRCSNFIAKIIGQKELILQFTIKRWLNCYLCSFWISNFRENKIKLTKWEPIPCDAQ